MPRILSDHPTAFVLIFQEKYTDAELWEYFRGDLKAYRRLRYKYSGMPGTRDDYWKVLQRLEAYEVVCKLHNVSDFEVEV